ncbi:MAG: signal recognition particle-docking protein FtsY, partial [Candidatus Dormibacteraeota bacterium]|nr:signal recognition particle-docking protein FtsY [Candidatus Dormibacteraeota bacterium]
MRLGRRRRGADDGDGPAEAPAQPDETPAADPDEEAGEQSEDQPVPLLILVEDDDEAAADGDEAAPTPLDEQTVDETVVDAELVHEAPDEVVSAPRRRGWWRRMSGRMGAGIRGAFRIRGKLDDDFYDDVLEALISADCGVGTSERLVARLRERVREDRIRDGAAALDVLKAEILAMLRQRDRTLRIQDVPSVLLMVGVNGSGKTTTTGKLAYRLRQEGRIPLVAAADTYRAAAIDQMRIWADRAGVDVVAHQPGGDPGAVVYDAIQAAFARRVDCILVDTAGRLHTKANLMAELQKVRRVAERLIPEAPQETLLVLDATTGMNALAQGRAFHEAVRLTGLVLTKLDGSARGGTVI